MGNVHVAVIRARVMRCMPRLAAERVRIAKNGLRSARLRGMNASVLRSRRTRHPQIMSRLKRRLEFLGRLGRRLFCLYLDINDFLFSGLAFDDLNG